MKEHFVKRLLLNLQKLPKSSFGLMPEGVNFATIIDSISYKRTGCKLENGKLSVHTDEVTTYVFMNDNGFIILHTSVYDNFQLGERYVIVINKSQIDRTFCKSITLSK